MTQSDFQSLVSDLDFEFSMLSEAKELLDIGIDQLDLETPKTVERLILLLDLTSQSLDCRIENLAYKLKQLHVYSDIEKVS